MDTDPRQQSEERRPKRVSQACEACRRKKSKCPGEKPACSLCTRLGQTCSYNEDGSMPEIRSAAMERRMNARFADLESKLETLIRNQPHSPSAQTPVVLGSHANNSPGSLHMISSRRSTPSRDDGRSQGMPTPRDHNGLPDVGTVGYAVGLVLKYFNCQPLPLFHPRLADDFRQRDTELLLALCTVAGECIPSNPTSEQHVLKAHRSKHESCARSLVLSRLYESRARLSTIQTFILLSFLKFTVGHFQLSNVYLGNAISLVQASGLIDPRIVVNDPVELEERRRCFWSVTILQNLFNPPNLTLGIHKYHSPLLKPASPSVDSKGELIPTNRLSDASPDGPPPGIITATLPMFEIFSKAAKYIVDTKNGSFSHPPWQSQSDYAAIVGELLELESTFTLVYRFDRTKMASYSKQTIEQNWSFWCTWLVNQCMYHTTLMLLNHPFINSRWIAAAQRCPRTFSQATSDLVVLHSNWIIRILEMLEEKNIALSDPFLGYCICVALTVFLHYRTAEIPGLRQNAEKGLAKGQNALNNIEACWHSINSAGHKFRYLERLDSGTQPQNPGGYESKSDILWDILIFSSPTKTIQHETLFQHSDFAVAPLPDSSTEKEAAAAAAAASSRARRPTPATRIPAPHGTAGSAAATTTAAAAAFLQPDAPPSVSGFVPTAPQQHQMQGSQFPAVGEQNLMTFDDQNLAAITEFLDQNSGRMFNEWWDFGDL